MHQELVDPFGRQIDYLRISVTDRCNLKCLYCRPRQHFQTLSHDDILRYEEIKALVVAFAEMGIRKIRISGGEPLVRKGIERCIQALSEINGLSDIALSTNGIYLGQLVRQLKTAGLKRVNISLDTLKKERYLDITGVNALERVMLGIEKAIEIGLNPVKVNVVLMKGINEDELDDFVQLAVRWPVEVRFIELMPMRNCFERDQKHFFSNQEAKKRIEQNVFLIPIEKSGVNVALTYHVADGLGRIGFISPLSCNFCDSCNRIRLKANGVLRLCLHEGGGLDLGKALREGRDKEDIKDLISKAIKMKPEKHYLEIKDADQADLVMTEVGG